MTDNTSEASKSPRPAVDVQPKATVLELHGYHVGKTIGSGSYATVKEANSKRHKCKVAIKIISKKKAPEDYLIKFLPREIDVIKYLRHPCLVVFYQCIETTNRMYLIMELAPKGDLLDEIRAKKYIEEKQAAIWFSQLIEGVDYIHERGVVHRDLKCENLILDAQNNLKITDFGFARAGMRPIDGQFLLSQTYCGSYAYAPPEILTGTPYPPQFADVWSSGVILYVMVFGRLPFDDSNHRELIHQVTRRGPVFNSKNSVSKECKDLILKILVKVSKRISVSSIKGHPWYVKVALPPQEPFLSSEPTSSRKPFSGIVKVDSALLSKRPSGSAPKLKCSNEKAVESRRMSSSYAQNVNGPARKNSGKRHKDGNTADGPSKKSQKDHDLDEFSSAVSTTD